MRVLRYGLKALGQIIQWGVGLAAGGATGTLFLCIYWDHSGPHTDTPSMWPHFIGLSLIVAGLLALIDLSRLEFNFMAWLWSHTFFTKQDIDYTNKHVAIGFRIRPFWRPRSWHDVYVYPKPHIETTRY